MSSAISCFFQCFSNLLLKAETLKTLLHRWRNWIAHLTSDQRVGGSNPSRCTIFHKWLGSSSEVILSTFPSRSHFVTDWSFHWVFETNLLAFAYRSAKEYWFFQCARPIPLFPCVNCEICRFVFLIWNNKSSWSCIRYREQLCLIFTLAGPSSGN